MSEEVRTKMMEQHQKILSGDAEAVAQAAADKEEAFATADADGDGLIQEAEFGTMCDFREDKTNEKLGGTLSSNAEERKAWFDALNTLTPDTDGFSRDDNERNEKVIGKTIIGEMMAAQAQPSE